MPDISPVALDEGLRRQLENLGSRQIAGWKVGLTSGRARDGFGEGFRPFGYILAERVFASGAEIASAQFDRVGIENELCFRIGRTLRGQVSRIDVATALATVAPAFEINEQRLRGDATVVERLADDLNQWGIVVGDQRRLDWLNFDFEGLQVKLSLDGKVVETVAAAGHIDDHLTSIAALARQLDRFGHALVAGAKVITGAYTRQSVVRASHWQGDFGTAIGTVAVTFD